MLGSASLYGSTFMVSIIVPAYNEGQTIEHCLRSILADAEPNEFEIVVVCNGCKDDTAERARKFVAAGVKVIETEVPSKTNAINLGDAAARSFPRFYVDADIELSAAAIRDVAALLTDDSEVLLAAPSAIVDYEHRDRWVRSYYKVWTKLPYVTHGVIGSGVYAFSRRGRARFDKFPEIIADDEFARLQVSPDERRSSPTSHFKITPPTSLRGLFKINTRVHAGTAELRGKFPHLYANDNTGPTRSLAVIARSPELWPHAPIYLGVIFCARLAARRKLRRGREKEWERDDTSRATFGTPS